MREKYRYIRITVDESQHRKIRIAASLNGQSMSRFMQTEVLRAADQATAGIIDVSALNAARHGEELAA